MLSPSLCWRAGFGVTQCDLEPELEPEPEPELEPEPDEPEPGEPKPDAQRERNPFSAEQMQHLRLVEIRRLSVATQHGAAAAETASHAATGGDAQEQAEKAEEAPAEQDLDHGGGLFL